MKSAAPADAPERAGTADLELKEAALYRSLADLPAIIVAYSGGVDSAYLAYASTRVLGGNALCVTADSASYPERHRQMAIRLAREFGFQHEIVRTDEMSRPEYRANPANRCYFCKHELYTRLSAMAMERGMPAIADGSNADDRGDYRPGRQAAREFGVLSPLDAAGLTKNEIRELSRRAGLADLGRARLRLPVVAHSVFQRGHRREAADDRARGKRAARPRLPDLPRPAS